VVAPTRSYLICSVQRAGSWLLCHALQDSGVLGVPAEYFHPGDEQIWRARWQAATEDEFLQALRDQPATANGVWASKMMWNYFPAAVARLRDWPRLGLAPGAAEAEVMEATFPGLRYVWLRRDDKLRQAISWWRAETTGQYALAGGDQPAPPPLFDREAITRLLQFAQDCEDGWRGWFSAHSIEPFELVYEEMTRDLATVVRGVAAFLGVALPPNPGPIMPRLRRQADQHTERLAALYCSPRPAPRLGSIPESR
jgi:LPS sulfotransferase NodH